MNLIKIQSYDKSCEINKKQDIVYLNLENIVYSTIINGHEDFTKLILSNEYRIIVLSKDFDKLNDKLLKEFNFIKLFNSKKYFSTVWNQKTFINLNKVSFVRRVGTQKYNYYVLYFIDSKFDGQYEVDEKDFNEIIKILNLKEL